MRAISLLKDARINSQNYLVELSIDEYLDLAQYILHKNEYQRRRVRASKTVYSLLKADLLRGCIIPPIVLAITSEPSKKNIELDNFPSFIHEEKDHLLILDGLQRTNSIIDLFKELESNQDEEKLKELKKHKIRAEIYTGINRLGILYRMLTLNTGQSPMSLRQQIEILYLDYSQVQVGDIELIREAEGRIAAGSNQYNFRDIVEGFNSYLERNELPIDRVDLLENIRSLEKLSKENEDTDLFEGFLKSWHTYMQRIIDITENTQLSNEYINQYGQPFGRNVTQVFKKAQAMSGFGAAVGKLRDFKIIESFDDIMTITKEIVIEQSTESFLEMINQKLDWISNNTKKIGNAQRMFFHYFFREIFNKESDSYKRLDNSVETAFRKYQSQTI